MLARVRVSTWFALALLLLIAARTVYEYQKTVSPQVRLQSLSKGLYRVTGLVDSITMLVEPVDSDQAGPRKAFAVRLASVQPIPGEPESHDFALSKLLPSTPVRIRFGRHRFDTDQVPLGYVFIEDRFLNAELVAAGGAAPKMLPGNSESLQRRIRNASQIPGSSHP